MKAEHEIKKQILIKSLTPLQMYECDYLNLGTEEAMYYFEQYYSDGEYGAETVHG